MAQELNNNLEELKKYAKEIREVYAAVATKIEELVELLNTPSEESSEIIQSLTARILEFVGEIKSFVKKERQIELKEINRLIKTLKLEMRHPENKLVAVIYSLNKEIKKIITAEETVLNK